MNLLSYGVYCLIDRRTNIIIYVGKAQKQFILERLGQHYAGLRKGNYSNKGLQDFVDKHGIDNLAFGTLIDGLPHNDPEIDEHEVRYVKMLTPDFNRIKFKNKKDEFDF